MYNPSLTRRKVHIGFGGLVTLAMGFDASAKDEPVYNISFKAEHENSIATFSGTSRQLLKVYEGNIKSELPNDFRSLNQGLEFIAQKLSEDSTYLNTFKRAQVNTPIKVYVVDYSRNIRLGTKSYYVSLSVEVSTKAGKVVINDLVAYSIEGWEGNIFVRRQGEADFESWYINSKTLKRKEQRWIIEEKNQRAVMNEIDITGIRAKLRRGLIKQKIS